jgi:hypothetical protein
VTFYDNLMEFKYFCEGNSAFMGHGMWWFFGNVLLNVENKNFKGLLYLATLVEEHLNKLAHKGIWRDLNVKTGMWN